jgi:thiamine-monophosphate kinase
MESEFIHWLRDRLPTSPALRLGPGDDAAILRLGDRAECVVSVDLVSDGVDFTLGSVDPRRIGRKALAVNLSDMAAMAAKPVAAVVALLLPRDNGLQLAQQLYEGLLPLAERYSLAIAGGDTNSWDGPLAISITVIGEVTAAGPLLRSGARPGDRIFVTGAFGGSILGHHLDFEPRVQAALDLHRQYPLHAGMDISDGLSLDLSRLCAESGVGAVVELDCVPVAPAAYQLDDKQSPREHALGDGEDFELLLAVPPDVAGMLLERQPVNVPLTDIGCFTAEPQILARDTDGSVAPLPIRGYQH